MPPSRITRATAASSAKSGTAASRARVSAASASASGSSATTVPKPPLLSTATKRKTRTYEAEGDDDGSSNVNGQGTLAAGPSRPPRNPVARPTTRARSTMKKPADEPPSRAAPTRTAPASRATRTTAASAARATRTTAAAAARAAPKASVRETLAQTRSRVGSTVTATASDSSSMVGGPTKKPRISAPTGTRMAAAAAAAKKTVSFAAGAKPEKENIAPTSNTGAKPGGIRGRPMRKAAGGLASASSTMATRSRKTGALESTADKPPLGPVSMPTPTNASIGDAADEDELTAEPLAPLRQSPKKKGRTGVLESTTLLDSDTTASHGFNNAASADFNATETGQMMLTSPAKRIPQPPVSPQETMRSPAKRGPAENMFIGGVMPKPGQTASSDLAAEKSTLLASPAKRPQSPIKGFGAGLSSHVESQKQGQKAPLLMSPAKRPGSAFKLPTRSFDLSQAVPSLPTMPGSPNTAGATTEDAEDKGPAMKPSQLLMAGEETTSDPFHSRGLLFKQAPPSLKLPSRKPSPSASKEDLTGDMFAPVRRSLSKGNQTQPDTEVDPENSADLDEELDYNHQENCLEADDEDSIALFDDEATGTLTLTDAQVQIREDVEMMSPRRSWPATFKMQAESGNENSEGDLADNSNHSGDGAPLNGFQMEEGPEKHHEEEETIQLEHVSTAEVKKASTPKATPKTTAKATPRPTRQRTSRATPKATPKSTSPVKTSAAFGLRSQDVDPYATVDNDSDDDDISRLPHPYNNAPETPEISHQAKPSRTPGTVKGCISNTSDGFTPLVNRLDAWAPAAPIVHSSDASEDEAHGEHDENIEYEESGEHEVKTPYDHDHDEFDDDDMEMEDDNVPGTPRSTHSANDVSHAHMTPSFTERQHEDDADIDAQFDTTSENEPERDGSEDERDDDVSMLDEEGFDDVDITEEDIALAIEAQEMSLLGPEDIEELNRSYEELEEEAARYHLQYEGAAQEYEEEADNVDENMEEGVEDDIDHTEHSGPLTEGNVCDDTNDHHEEATPIPPVTPARYITKEFHTVSKVPLKDADEPSPSPSDRRTRLRASRPSIQRHSIGHAPESPARNTDTIEPPPITPARPQSSWSNAATPIQTPGNRLNDNALRGATIFVDVFTADGADASAIFVELLTQMGAKCVSEWAWDPQNPSQMGKIGITHVVFKDGSQSTLDKVQEAQGLVHCVGVSWVLDCERDNTWVEEPPYYIYSGSTPRSARRKTTGMLGSPTTPIRTGTRRRSSRRQSTVWERTPTDSDKGVRDDTDGSTWQLSPVPVTPAPEAISRYVATLAPETPSPNDRNENYGMYGVESTTPTDPINEDGNTPLDEDRMAMLQRTCPPPKRRAVSGKAGSSKKQAVSWVVTPEKEEPKNVMMRLLAARRKSLQFAPKVSSPLSKQWKQREN
ncbi:signal transducer protein [Ceratocystis lukuohia]|uniref:Signal transducer protein n=1 Tax=Ceratocystis lukuohia TaxID=2019550 RepID=A0ABR4MC48_9PEZI